MHRSSVSLFIHSFLILRFLLPGRIGHSEPVVSFVDLNALRDVNVRTLVVEEAKMTLSAQIQRLCVLTRVL